MEIANYKTYDNWKELLNKSSASSRYHKIIESESGPKDFAQSLRLERNLAWLNCAASTLKDANTTEDICRYWSDRADEIILKAWQQSGCGNLDLCLFALGKLGAQELNLSSDVDLFVLSNKPASAEDLKSFKIFVHLLSETGPYGFCFRVDTELRPGGRLGPVISSLNQFQDYYWNYGATWEKVAFIRLRNICGSTKIADEAKEISNRFTYRKYLDFTLFNDLKGLRDRIHSTVTVDPLNLNLKLIPGGIRDIELFINALQVIHGGRINSLQTYSTTKAARTLEEKAILPEKEIRLLIDTYWKLRDLENLSQIQEDRQTHSWNDNKNSMRENLPETDSIIETCQKIEPIVATLFSFDESSSPLPKNIAEQQKWLQQLGFSDESVNSTWPELISLTAKSQRHSKDEEARSKFLHLFIDHLKEKKQGKDLALGLLRDFVRSTRAKASFFSTLLTDHQLISDLAELFYSSPYLGGILASRPELIDSFVYRRQGDYSNVMDQLLEELAEQKLLTTIAAASDFLKSLEVEKLTNALSQTANEISSTLLRKLNGDFQTELEVYCLGKWGGSEVGLHSDLDFLFISPSAPSENDHKVAKRFISRLTETHKGGSLYEIDLRLRPSGQAGPMIVTFDSFIEYTKNSAKAWERLSYLKGRMLEGVAPNSKVLNLVLEKGLNRTELVELAEIQVKLRDQNKVSNKISLKYSKGGLVEVELFLQKKILKNQIDPKGTGSFNFFEELIGNLPREASDLVKLKNLYRDLRVLEQVYQLKSNHQGSQLSNTTPCLPLIADTLNFRPSQFISHLEAQLNTAHDIMKDLDPLRGQE